MPVGGEVSVRCRGGGCPFKTRPFKARDGVATLTRSFRTARLQPRTALEISVSAPEAITKVFQITVRRLPREPRIMVLCLRVGSAEPSRCPTR